MIKKPIVNYLELQGIGSYKDCTRFNFTSSSTAIKGLNGAGKSTLLGAFRFFLDRNAERISPGFLLHKGISNQVHRGYVEIALNSNVFELNNSHCDVLRRSFSLDRNLEESFCLNGQKLNREGFIALTSKLSSVITLIGQDEIMELAFMSSESLYNWIASLSIVRFESSNQLRLIEDLDDFKEHVNHFITNDVSAIDVRLENFHAQFLAYTEANLINHKLQIIDLIQSQRLVDSQTQDREQCEELMSKILSELKDNFNGTIEEDLVSQLEYLKVKLNFISLKKNEFLEKKEKLSVVSATVLDTLKNLKAQESRIAKYNEITKRMAIVKGRLRALSVIFSATNESSVPSLCLSLSQRLKDAEEELNFLSKKEQDADNFECNFELLENDCLAMEADLIEVRSKLKMVALESHNAIGNVRNVFGKDYINFVSMYLNKFLGTSNLHEAYKTLKHSLHSQATVKCFGPLFWYLESVPELFLKPLVSVLNQKLRMLVVRSKFEVEELYEFRKNNAPWSNVSVLAMDEFRKLKKHSKLDLGNFRVFDGEVASFSFDKDKAVLLSFAFNSSVENPMLKILQEMCASYVLVESLDSAKLLISESSNANCVLPSGELVSNHNLIRPFRAKGLFAAVNQWYISIENQDECELLKREKSLMEKIEHLRKRKFSIASQSNELKILNEKRVQELKRDTVEMETVLTFLSSSNINPEIFSGDEIANLEREHKCMEIELQSLSLKTGESSSFLLRSASVRNLELSLAKLEASNEKMTESVKHLDAELLFLQESVSQLQQKLKNNEELKHRMQLQAELMRLSKKIGQFETIAERVLRRQDTVREEAGQSYEELHTELKSLDDIALRRERVLLTKRMRSQKKFNNKVVQCKELINLKRSQLASELKKLEAGAAWFYLCMEQMGLERHKLIKNHFTAFKAAFEDLTQSVLNFSVQLRVDHAQKRVTLFLNESTLMMCSLSGAQKTLVGLSLALALARESLVVLDEADSALDSANCFRYIELLRSSSQQFIISSFHSSVLAACDQTYLLTLENRETRVTLSDGRKLSLTRSSLAAKSWESVEDKENYEEVRFAGQVDKKLLSSDLDEVLDQNKARPQRKCRLI